MELVDLGQRKPIDRPVKNHRPATTLRKAEASSRITNGKKLLPDSDGRLKVNRRFRDITAALLVDQAGEDRCSEARKQLIRRFAAAACLAELMEARLANGEEIDITQHALLVSTMVRVAQRIGIDRIARDVTPSLNEYLRTKQTIEGEVVE